MGARICFTEYEKGALGVFSRSNAVSQSDASDTAYLAEQNKRHGSFQTWFAAILFKMYGC